MELVIFRNNVWLHKIDLPDGDIRMEVDNEEVTFRKKLNVIEVG